MSKDNQAPVTTGISDGRNFIPISDGTEAKQLKEKGEGWYKYTKQAGQEPEISGMPKPKAEKEEKEDNHKGHKR